MPQDVAHSVLFAASEVVGFAKTGGLADVVGSLPRALARRGHRCVVMLPLYRSCRLGGIPIEPTEHTFRVNIGYRSVPGRLWRATLPDSDVPVYLVEQAEYYERDDPAQGRGLYQYSLPDGKKSDYADAQWDQYTWKGKIYGVPAKSATIGDSKTAYGFITD